MAKKAAKKKGLKVQKNRAPAQSRRVKKTVKAIRAVLSDRASPEELNQRIQKFMSETDSGNYVIPTESGRRIFYIDVGNIPKDKIKEHLAAIMKAADQDNTWQVLPQSEPVKLESDVQQQEDNMAKAKTGAALVVTLATQVEDGNTILDALRTEREVAQANVDRITARIAETQREVDLNHEALVQESRRLNSKV